jgi:hypothetical protein
MKGKGKVEILFKDEAEKVQKTCSSLGLFPFALFTPLEQIHQGKQDNPHDIDKVPIKLCGFYPKVFFTGVMV